MSLGKSIIKFFLYILYLFDFFQSVKSILTKFVFGYLLLELILGFLG